MVTRLALRGGLAGLVGGILAFVFARVFAEPRISAAIDYEGARDAAQNALDAARGQAGAAEAPEIFSRTVQKDVGLGIGVIAFGIAMGLLVAVVFAVCQGRVGGLRPRSTALLVAGAGFLGFYLVPFLKYPANPPAIGHVDTIAQRSAVYLVMVACSLLFLMAAVLVGQRLRPRLGSWNATLLAAGGFAVAIGVLMAVLPSTGELGSNPQVYGDVATETPQPLLDAAGRLVFPGFPADLLAEFRMFSVAAQLILWAAIGLVFAPLAERLLQEAAAARDARRSDLVSS